MDVSKAIDKKPGADSTTEFKKWFEEQLAACPKTQAQIDEECGFTACSYAKTDGKDGWSSNIPSADKWEKMKLVIGLSDEWDWIIENNVEERGFVEPTGGLHGGSGVTVGKFTGKQLSENAIAEAAKKWQGWGTALKPSTEFWILCRKPFVEPNLVANVLKHGTGGINIDGTRIHGPDAKGEEYTVKRLMPGADTNKTGKWKQDDQEFKGKTKPGRWPSNVVLSHSPGCVLKGMKKVRPLDGPRKTPVQTEADGSIQFTHKPVGYQKGGYTADDGMEEIEDWACVEGCPVKEMDAQSGDAGAAAPVPTLEGTKQSPRGIYGAWASNVNSLERGTFYGDVGGASRFFKTFGPRPDDPFAYFPKPDRTERDKGLETLKKSHTFGPMAGRGQPGLKCQTCGKWKASGNPCQCAKPKWKKASFNRPDVANIHPTVKSVDLMSWLCKMVTPPGGLVLDPFAGSGSTGIAALKMGFRFVGIEKEAQYAQIARLRIEGDQPLFNMLT